MSIHFTIGDAKKVGPHMWSASITPADVQRFGQPQQRTGVRSVIGVIEPSFNEAIHTLSIPPETAKVFNVGSMNEALIIDIGQKKTDISEAHAFLMRTDMEEPSHGRKGDLEFLEECKCNLHAPLVAMAERLLGEIRREYPGELSEGKARKWVNHPDNFVALTIQPRDESFAIHIKGKPEDFRAPSLDIKPDRGSYSRFKLQTTEQLEDTIKVILSSARLSVK